MESPPLLAAAIFGLIEVAFQFLPTVVQRQIKAAAGQGAPAGLEQLVTVAASPITWTDKTFKATDVAMDGDLAFSGVFT